MRISSPSRLDKRSSGACPPTGPLAVLQSQTALTETTWSKHTARTRQIVRAVCFIGCESTGQGVFVAGPARYTLFWFTTTLLSVTWASWSFNWATSDLYAMTARICAT